MFGDLVAQLRADLTQYEKDLNRAESLYKAHLQRLKQQSLGVGSGGSGGGAGGGGGFRHIGAQGSISQQERAAEAAERRFRRVMVAGEADLRRFYSQWDSASRENEKRQVEASRSAAQARINNLRQISILQRQLDRDDEQANRQAVEAGRAGATGRLNDLKQIAAFKKFLTDEDERASKEATAQARAAAQSRLNDLKQIQVFEKYLADERIKSLARIAEAEKRVQEESRKFYQRSGGNLPGVGNGTFGSAGNFLALTNTRGLDEANAKWLKQQQLIAQAGGLSGTLQKRLDEIGRNQLSRMKDGIQGFVNTLKFITIGGAAGILTGLIGAGIQMNRQFMQQRMTLATILGISDKIVNSRGKEVDSATALTLNLKQAEVLYGRIRKEAAGSILTGQELFTSVSANFGLGRRAGLSPDQIIQVTKLVTQLAKTQGLQGEGMLAQETRALFTGEGLESATVARMLGINRKSQIQSAQDKGNFFPMIMNRLRTGLPAIEQFSHSFDAFKTTLQTAAQDLTRLSFEKVFEKITDRLGKFTALITQDKVEMWADKISDALVGAYDAIERFAKSDGWKAIETIFKFIVANAGTITQVFLAMKGAQMLTAGASAVRGLTAAGGLVATGAPRAIPALGAVAGGLNVVGAGLIGYGIGTAFNNKFGGVREEGQAAETEAETQRKFSLIARRQQIRRNIAGYETQLGKDRAISGNATQGAVTLRLLERERGRLADVDRQVQRQEGTRSQTSFAEATAKRLGLPDAAEMVRLARRAPEIDLDRRKKLNEERVEAAGQLAKMSENKIRILRADAEAEKLQAEKNIKDTAKSSERRAAVIKGIEEKLKRDIAMVREEERIEVGKKFAEMTGDKRKMLDLEYRETLLNIKKMHVAKEYEVRLRQGAEYDYLKKVRDFQSEERLDRQKFVADVTDNELLQIINGANRAYKERKTSLEQTVQNETLRNKEIASMRIQVFEQAERKIIEKRNELSRKALDLNRDSQEFENRLHKARLQMEKDVLEAQKRLAKETRDMMRERIQAEKELKRAQEDRLRKIREIGTGADVIGGSVRIGGVRGAMVGASSRAAQGAAGLRGADLGLQSDANRLFASEELQTQLTDRFLKQTGNQSLAQAMAEQQVREFSNQAGQAGGTQNILGKLGELGISTGGGFQERLQQIEGRGVEVANARAKGEQETGMSDLERERQDINDQLAEAKRRMSDLDERQAEVLQSYKDTIVNLHDQFDLQVKDTAANLANLARQANEVANAFKNNHLPLPAQSVGVIRQFSKFTPQKAQTEAEQTLAETGSFVFNEGAIKIDAAGMDPQKLLDTITKAAQDLSRRTAPSRR